MSAKVPLLCPILTAGYKKNTDCLGPTCFWWDGNACSVHSIAHLLREWAEARQEISKRFP